MKRQMTQEQRKFESKRQGIEQIIERLMSYHRRDRCYVNGKTRDTIHAVLYAGR